MLRHDLKMVLFPGPIGVQPDLPEQHLRQHVRVLFARILTCIQQRWFSARLGYCAKLPGRPKPAVRFAAYFMSFEQTNSSHLHSHSTWTESTWNPVTIRIYKVESPARQVWHSCLNLKQLKQTVDSFELSTARHASWWSGLPAADACCGVVPDQARGLHA